MSLNLRFSKATKFEYETSFLFIVVDKWTNKQKDQVDKLKKINLYVVATNTWQGYMGHGQIQKIP